MYKNRKFKNDMLSLMEYKFFKTIIYFLLNLRIKNIFYFIKIKMGGQNESKNIYVIDDNE